MSEVLAASIRRSAARDSVGQHDALTAPRESPERDIPVEPLGVLDAICFKRGRDFVEGT